MTECLRLKKSNCKNCYKCIRNCPVKSIRFSDNQANIVPEECILCGHCFVACPQGAKEIRNDVPVARTLIASGARLCERGALLCGQFRWRSHRLHGACA